jgi:nitroreductase
VATAEQLGALSDLAEAFRPWPRARAVLLSDAPKQLFLGIAGSYGGVSGAPHALVFIGAEDAEAAVGYTGEALVLEATRLGLNTCWVGGFFDPFKARSLVALAPGERVHAVSPVGTALQEVSRKEKLVFGAGRPKSRQTLDAIGRDHGRWPEWARCGLELVQVAPSATNRQPCGASGWRRAQR